MEDKGAILGERGALYLGARSQSSDPSEMEPWLRHCRGPRQTASQFREARDGNHSMPSSGFLVAAAPLSVPVFTQFRYRCVENAPT